jgi:hypothetical protein
MGKRYAVLYGANGVKDDFRTLGGAQKFAQAKADSMGKAVEVDKITTYPNARAGETDWSQRAVKTVKPSGNAPKKRRGGEFGGFDNPFGF